MTAYLKTSNLVTLIFLAAMCWHFGTVAGLIGAAPVGQSDMFLRLGVILGGIIVVSFVAAMILQKRQNAPLLPDEREQKIERISEGVGTLMLYLGMLILAWFAFTPLSPVQFVNGLLAIVSVTELVKLLIVIYLHGREVI